MATEPRWLGYIDIARPSWLGLKRNKLAATDHQRKDQKAEKLGKMFDEQP